MSASTTKLRLIVQFAGGIAGGVLLGIPLFLALMNYGGNNGCWPLVDYIFGTAGYESCGLFGAIIGIILGSIIGVIIFTKVKITRYIRTALILLFATFLFPTLYAAVGIGPSFIGAALAFILMFAAASTVPTVAAIGCVYGIRYMRKQGANKDI